MSTTARPVIDARSCSVKAPPSRLANRNNSRVSWGATTGDAPGSRGDRPVSHRRSRRRHPTHPQEAIVVEGSKQLCDEQRVAGRRPQPFPQRFTRCPSGDRAGHRHDVDLVERAEADVSTEALADPLDQAVEGGRARRQTHRPDAHRIGTRSRGASIAASTVSDRSSAQCRSSTMRSTGSFLAISSIRSTLDSTTAKPRSPPSSNGVGSTSRSPSRRLPPRQAAEPRHQPVRHGAGTAHELVGRHVDDGESGLPSPLLSPLHHEVGLADPGLTL